MSYRYRRGLGSGFHASGCQVDGGTRVHGRRGFWCPRCAEGPDKVLEGLMRRAENRRVKR